MLFRSKHQLRHPPFQLSHLGPLVPEPTSHDLVRINEQKHTPIRHYNVISFTICGNSNCRSCYAASWISGSPGWPQSIINAISRRGEFWMFCKEIHGITHHCKKDFLLSLCAEFVKPFSARVYTVSDIDYLSSHTHFMLLIGYECTTIYGGALYGPNLAQIAPCCRNRLSFTHHFRGIDGGGALFNPHL